MHKSTSSLVAALKHKYLMAVKHVKWAPYRCIVCGMYLHGHRVGVSNQCLHLFYSILASTSSLVVDVNHNGSINRWCNHVGGSAIPYTKRLEGVQGRNKRAMQKCDAKSTLTSEFWFILPTSNSWRTDDCPLNSYQWDSHADYLGSHQALENVTSKLHWFGEYLAFLHQSINIPCWPSFSLVLTSCTSLHPLHQQLES